jgi:alpha-amylase
MKQQIIRSLAAVSMVLSAAPGFGKSDESWQDRIIYFALVDRFENGQIQNDTAYGDPECNNPKDPHAYQGGDLEGLRQRLPDIETLGADALWLTPLYKGVPTKAGQNCGFPGYWAAFSEPYEFELDPRFGSAADFDAVLAEARSRDMRTILDMVVNHAGYGAPLVSQRPDWLHDPKTCSSLGLAEIFCPLAGLPDFNHRVPAAASYLLDVHKQWTEHFDIDGIRMDTVKHVEPWYFKDWIQGIRQSKSDLFVFGELLDEGSFGSFQPYLDAGFEGLFNFPLRRALIDTFAKGASVDVAASRVREMLGLFGQQQSRWLVTLLDNHDVPRFMEEFPKFFSPQIVHERYKLALAALLTLPGIPQLTYGNEVGMYGGADPDNRRMMPQWAFSPRFDEQDHPGFVTKPGQVWAYLQRLIEVRKEHQALTRGDFDEIWRQNDPKSPNVWAFVRHLTPETNVDATRAPAPILVIINNGDAGSGALRLPLRGHFREGATLRSIPLEADAATGQLVPDNTTYRIEQGALEVELKGRSVLLLNTGEQGP